MPTDTERLDFLNTLECGLDHEAYGEYAYYSGPRTEDIRAVIDRAIAERGWNPQTP